MKLIATRNYSYNTRRLRAGDEFEANEYWARVLVGARRANYAPVQKEVPKPVARAPEVRPPVRVEPETKDEDIDSLRAKAEKLGIDVDGRWGPARLQSEIALASRK